MALMVFCTMCILLCIFAISCSVRTFSCTVSVLAQNNPTLLAETHTEPYADNLCRVPVVFLHVKEKET
jgi:hypothetical protein